jgi:hypothetical protein
MRSNDVVPRHRGIFKGWLEGVFRSYGNTQPHVFTIDICGKEYEHICLLEDWQTGTPRPSWLQKAGLPGTTDAVRKDTMLVVFLRSGSEKVIVQIPLAIDKLRDGVHE